MNRTKMLSRLIACELGSGITLLCRSLAGLNSSANRVAQESGGADRWRRDRI